MTMKRKGDSGHPSTGEEEAERQAVELPLAHDPQGAARLAVDGDVEGEAAVRGGAGALQVELAELHAAALAQILPVGLDLIGDGGEALLAQLLVRTLEPRLGRLQPGEASPLLLGQLRAEGSHAARARPSGRQRSSRRSSSAAAAARTAATAAMRGGGPTLQVGGHLDHVVTLRRPLPRPPSR